MKKAINHAILAMIIILLLVISLTTIVLLWPQKDNSTIIKKMIEPIKLDDKTSPTPVTSLPIILKEFNHTLKENFDIDNFNWKIINYTIEKEVGQIVGGALLGKKAKGIYIVPQIQITNIGIQPELFNYSHIKIITNNATGNIDAQATAYLQDTIAQENINAGIIKKGSIAIEIPGDAKLTIQIIGKDSIHNVFLKQ